MTTRLRKETRELLPVLIGTAVLMAAPGMLRHEWTEAVSMFSLFAFGLGCAVMSGMTFGTELQHRTLGLLLSQPIRRSVLWREKMLVLGVAIAVCFGAELGCLVLGRPGTDWEPGAVGTLALVALCAFCGTPYLTLLTRSGIGGVVFAAVLPSFIGGISGAVAERVIPNAGEGNVILAGVVSVVVYCVVAFWRGYRRFQDLEVRDGSGRELTLPAGVEGALARGLGWIVPGVTSPFVALAKKELRLQQMSFVIAGVFSALVVVAAVVRSISTDWGDGILTADVAIYAILLPFIVGAMAVAEERGWGISEWHLTLPASALKQWLAKMSVALPTSVALGLVLPGLWFLVGWIFFGWPSAQPGPLSAETVVSFLLAVVWILLAHLLATSVAIYTASFCGNTIRAILLAFGIIATGGSFVGLMIGAMQKAVALGGFQPRGSMDWGSMASMLLFAGLLLVMGLLQALAFANFRRCGVPLRWFVVQLIGIFMLLGSLGLVFFSLLLFLKFI